MKWLRSQLKLLKGTKLAVQGKCCRMENVVSHNRSVQPFPKNQATPNAFVPSKSGRKYEITDYLN